MFIGLHELEVHPVRFKVEIPAGQIEYDSKITQASGLRAEGTAQLLNHSLGEIRVQGNLEVTVEATCDRCLEPAQFPIDRLGYLNQGGVIPAPPILQQDRNRYGLRFLHVAHGPLL